MKRSLLVLAAVALALPASALAKGASEATIQGPGLGKGLTLRGDGESNGTKLGNLAMKAGFFPAAFGQQPDPMLRTRPKGELGPRYTITWVMPGPNNDVSRLQQEFYPYAKPYAVTYMKPGQSFFDSMRTHGGWFVSPTLRATLISAGLPRAASTATSGRDWTNPSLAAIPGALLLLGAGAVVVLRRRQRS
jgi:hypothetical protein